MMRSLLFYRLIIINGCALAGLAWAFLHGYPQIALGADTSGICYAIVALFVFGLIATIIRAHKISRLLDTMKSGDRLSLNGRKMLAKQAYLSDISTLCEKLGMFGTVVGFLIAFYGIDPDGAPKAIMAHILVGLAVAFFTTAVGFVAGTWLGINARILHTATVSLIEDSSDAGQ